MSRLCLVIDTAARSEFTNPSGILAPYGSLKAQIVNYVLFPKYPGIKSREYSKNRTILVVKLLEINPLKERPLRF
jgi:hypothetical protein